MIPKRGEIWFADHEPTKGREQQGRRPVLVVSSTKHNVYFPPLVAPVSSGAIHARDHGLAVSLSGTGCTTTGVVLCQQVRALDLQARGAKRVEAAPEYVVADVVARIAAIMEYEGH